MSRKKLIQKYALGQILSEVPNFDYDEIILGLENNVEQVVDNVVVYQPYEDLSYQDIAEAIETMHDILSDFAEELEAL